MRAPRRAPPTGAAAAAARGGLSGELPPAGEAKWGGLLDEPNDGLEARSPASPPPPFPLTWQRRLRALGTADWVLDCAMCVICLDKVALQEIALVKGCSNAS
ncbi:unnamed protein product [Urochloa humidicola]